MLLNLFSAFGAWLIANPDEALATATGLAGAFLLARKGRWAAHGWIAFLASNAAWIYFARRNGHPGLLVQQLGFTITTCIGLWVWLLQPRFQWDEWRGDFEGRPTMWIMPLIRWRGRRIDLHKMVGADMAGCFHTHPARAIRIVLWGGYIEEIEIDSPNYFVPKWSEGGSTDWVQIQTRSMRRLRPGHISTVAPDLSHRIDTLLNGRVSYSLWLRGVKTHRITLRGPGWPAGAEAD